ncbi:hypothetical protein C8A03DRAFT_12108 [Achaetomium macrosporum]|uniref:Uncharacterized protein n=1 Tax=Achaetomium macrosporum TaxID=79813 RepID=A0AAN7CHA8_9PEZI|nr:hypothetical protein C8A03DRAFT_12108 [Achaetomium macrosporum]
MPPDQGAKFHHEYCAFPEHEHAAFAPASSHKPVAAIAARSALESEDALRLAGNASAELPLRPPFALLSGPEFEDEDQRIRPPPPAWDLFRRAASALASLQKRQWACPSGTSSCASIGYPNSCCRADETCVEVPDTGLGPVGCCPAGAACGGGISGCPDGSTTCGSEVGGGCCIPGFVCAGVGCKFLGISSQPPSLTTLTTTSTSIIPLPTPSTVLVTVTITLTPSAPSVPPAVTSTITHTVSPSSSGSGSGPGAPFRPTSAPVTNTNTFCPTGFYPCLATAGAGCCQTGRDCAVSSCPPFSSETVVQSNGVTVVAPAGATGPSESSSGSASCASGWFLCNGQGDGEGEGCCPSGYTCGTASCFATQAGVTGATASVAKGLPGMGTNGGTNGRVRAGRGWWLAGMVVGWTGWMSGLA